MVSPFKDEEDLTSLSAWRLATFPRRSLISAKTCEGEMGLAMEGGLMVDKSRNQSVKVLSRKKH